MTEKEELELVKILTHTATNMISACETFKSAVENYSEVLQDLKLKWGELKSLKTKYPELVTLENKLQEFEDYINDL